ncbi:hypothetical protein DNTS_029069 [Danionella cerebrum]|uniref:Uncharacterized protein n=1 Tax=Danionella cerebrum TaxID=2873325 RepID=A0A553NL20_9TELE|nr:hypothetical protein DNTS_029069 [Danionella translucida]
MQAAGLSPGEKTAPGLLLTPGVRWGQTPINQSTPWETDEPPAKQQHREPDSTGPPPGPCRVPAVLLKQKPQALGRGQRQHCVELCCSTLLQTQSEMSLLDVDISGAEISVGTQWVPPVVAATQPSLLAHSYGIPSAYSQGVSVQSPVIGVTPAIQTPLAPHHPLMTAHFQLPSLSSQPPSSLLLNLANQSSYGTSQPSITPSPLTTAGQVVHPTAPSVMGNGHMTHPLIHPTSLPSAALPLTNGQAMTQPTQALANQESPNGLQMLRTVGMGKYEFTDPSHPKGKA